MLVICNTAESVQQIRSLRKFVKRQCKIDDIKKFEKIKYLTLMIILLLGEIIYIGSVMYDFN